MQYISPELKYLSAIFMGATHLKGNSQVLGLISEFAIVCVVATDRNGPSAICEHMRT